MEVRPESRSFEEPARGEFVFPLRDLLQATWRRLWVIVLVAALFCGAALAWSSTQTPLYEASTKILIGQGNGLATDPTYVQSLQDLTLTMAEAVESKPVAESVAKRTNLGISSGEVLAGLSAEPLPETQFIEVSYIHPDPVVARKVVNATGEAVSARIASTSEGGITARPWEKAETPVVPISPRPAYSGFLALVLGVFVGLGLVFLLEYMDDSWGSPEDAERVSGVPNLASVPKFSSAKRTNKPTRG